MLTRIGAADRTAVTQPFKLNADGYDVGLMALDAKDRVWMAWGQVLTSFDPDTGAIKQWTLPPYSGLARLYSMDGRIDAMTMAADGEIWLAATMVSAVFDFNSTREGWDKPINLPFVPVEPFTTLAEPAPGVVTINGAALKGGALDPNQSPQFGIIATATRTVTTLSLPVTTYVAIGGGELVYVDWAGGRIVRYDVSNATSSVLAAGSAVRTTIASPTIDAQGDVWLPFTTHGYPGVARLNPATGAVTQFPFPIVVRFYEPAPSPSPPGTCMPHVCLPRQCDAILISGCVPTLVSQNPEVQGMAPDARGDIWMVTRATSMRDPRDVHSMFAPVVELKVGP